MFPSTWSDAAVSLKAAALSAVVAASAAGTAQAAPIVHPQVVATVNAGLATQSQSRFRVPSLRQRAPAVAQSNPEILKAARHNRVQQPKPGQTLNGPFGLAVGQSGTVYVTNIYAGVTIYNEAHKYLGAITSGTNVPSAVALSFNGDIFVANNNGNDISYYTPAGQQIGTVNDPTLVNPLGMYIDQDDTIWVLDSGGTVHPYLSDGTVLTTVHTGGSAIGPWGPDVTVWGVLTNSGTYDEVVQNRAEADHFGATFPIFYSSNFLSYAGGEAEDGAGQQYVTDINQNAVEIWNSAGSNEIGRFATPGTPSGIAVDSSRKRIYVAMPTLNEVYCYSMVPPYKQLAIIQ